MSDYSIVPNAALTATADAIRAKTGSQASIEFDNSTGFADAIDDIPTGGGDDGIPNLKDIVFVDYDGSIVQQYTKAEFLALDSMPANPSHTGLTAQGWNWSLSDAQDYVRANGIHVIGQSYTTTDGKTRIYITVTDATAGVIFHLMFKTSVKGGVTIEWGDGTTEASTANANSVGDYSHTYPTPGDYVIKLQATSGTYIPDRFLAGRGFFGGYSDTPPLLVTAIEFGDNVTALGTDILTNADNIKTVSIPVGIVDYAPAPFSSRGLKCIIMPSGASGWTSGYLATNAQNLRFLSLPKNAATNNGSLADGALPSLLMFAFSDVGSASGRVLYGSRNIQKAAIPGTYTDVNSNYTRECTSLRSITIPATVTSVARYGLNGANMREYHFLPTTPPTLASTSDMFRTANNPKIYVPYSADHSILTAYQNETNWSTFAQYLQEEPQ